MSRTNKQRTDAAKQRITEQRRATEIQHLGISGELEPGVPPFLLVANRVPLSTAQQSRVDGWLATRQTAAQEEREDPNRPHNWRTPEALALVAELEMTAKQRAEERRAAEAPKREAAAAERERIRGEKEAAYDDQVVVRLVQGNPKRAGTASHDYWEWYVDRITVGEYTAKFVAKYGDEEGLRRATQWLRWDVKHKLVRLDPK
jgi:hypothetical protein